MPEREIILLIDGNGYKPGALAWLKQAVASQDAKLIHVFNLVELSLIHIFLRIVARREQGPRLRDEPFPVPPQRPVQPYEIRIEIAQQVAREPRVQEDVYKRQERDKLNS